jgi:ADP-heptose:LPS heptosyltransferase
MHLAAAVGTPCVAIFAARSLPGQWFPLGEGHEVLYRRVECMGCGLDECIAERKRCIRGITVDEVAAAVTRQIERRKERSASEHRTPGPMPPSAVR